MYTLRFFTQLGEVDRSQIYLGENYSVKKPSQEDKESGISCRLFYGSNTEGFAIYKNQYAFIMSANGQTFETLNRPVFSNSVEKSPTKGPSIKSVLEYMHSICVESLPPEVFEDWELVLRELAKNRSDLDREIAELFRNEASN